MSRPARGGGRWVEVDPERLARWLHGFGERHGGYEPTGGGEPVTIRGNDGAIAELHPPVGAPPVPDLAAFLDETAVPRRFGLLLVRRGGYAVGLADGDHLVASKVDSRYVQGRTAAGGWSQHRFARRRDNQAKALAGAAADLAVRLLLPERDRLAALVTGGDRQLVDDVLADARLTPLHPLRDERFLNVADPRQTVLRDAVSAARTVRIRVVEPPA